MVSCFFNNSSILNKQKNKEKRLVSLMFWELNKFYFLRRTVIASQKLPIAVGVLLHLSSWLFLANQIENSKLIHF